MTATLITLTALFTASTASAGDTGRDLLIGGFGVCEEAGYELADSLNRADRYADWQVVPVAMEESAVPGDAEITLKCCTADGTPLLDVVFADEDAIDDIDLFTAGLAETSVLPIEPDLDGDGDLEGAHGDDIDNVDNDCDGTMSETDGELGIAEIDNDCDGSGFAGTKPSDAYFVKVDQSTTTQNDAKDGGVHAIDYLGAIYVSIVEQDTRVGDEIGCAVIDASAATTERR